MTPSETPPSPRRLWRWLLTTLAALVVLVALFYGEEDWRGRRAWNECKQALQARGAKLDWADYIPAAVPDDDNIFAVPEMREWFSRHGTNQSDQLLQKLNYPGWDNPGRTVVARLTIGLPGATPPVHCAVIPQGDPKARLAVGLLIKAALGPVVVDPAGYFYTKNPAKEIQPMPIFLKCETMPTQADLEKFMPFPLVLPEGSTNEDARVEPVAGGGYNVTLRTPSTVEEFLKWNEQLEPEFTLILHALQRPDARMEGDYSDPSEMPVPNFAAIRALSQRLAARARCHLALGQHEKAADDLTFMHQMSRLLEARPAGKPMTMVGAMLNVALTGLYVEIIENGLRLKMWQEPELAALERQLEEINLRPLLVNAVSQEPAVMCHMAEVTPRKLFDANWSKRRAFVLYYLIPQGWTYQNMVVYASLQQNLEESFGPADQPIEPHKIDAATQEMDSMWEVQRRSLFGRLAAMAIPSLSGPGKSFVSTQTKVNQAQIACALERYRRAQGRYPEWLEALTPQFIDRIPNDVVGGQPPHYRVNPDGSFLLYSIGWDEQDHGGQGGLDLVWAEK